MQISRSEQKRRIKEVERLVVELIELPETVLTQMPIAQDLQAHIVEATRLQGGARQRQIKYLTKLLRELPLEEIYRLLSQHRGKALAEKKQVHELEFYRNALIEEALAHDQLSRQQDIEWGEVWESQVIAELLQRLPSLDGLGLARLAYFFAKSRNPRYSREIFRALRSALEQQERVNLRAGQNE